MIRSDVAAPPFRQARRPAYLCPKPSPVLRQGLAIRQTAALGTEVPDQVQEANHKKQLDATSIRPSPTNEKGRPTRSALSNLFQPVAYSATAAATSTDTPLPIVDESEIFFM